MEITGISQALFIIGSSIIGILGLVHLIFTFYTNKFNAFDPDVTDAMKGATLVITKETTVWRAWIGFNASHSLGALLFASIYIPLAVSHMSFIIDNRWFAVLPSLMGISYVLLAQKFWFRVPFFGTLISTICFIIAFVLVN